MNGNIIDVTSTLFNNLILIEHFIGVIEMRFHQSNEFHWIKFIQMLRNEKFAHDLCSDHFDGFEMFFFFLNHC